MKKQLLSIIIAISLLGSFCQAKAQAGVPFSQAGAALNFNGSNNYVSVPDNANLDFGTNDFTVEADFQSTASQSNYAGVVSKDDDNSGSGNGAGWQLVIVNNSIAAEFTDGSNFFGAGNGLQGVVNITDGNWHHLAMVVSRLAGSITLYVDGVVDGSVINPTISTMNINNTAMSMLIGVERSYSIFTNGNIDEVRVWNYARTQCPINSGMNCELAPSSRGGLAAYYKFNEGVANGNNPMVMTAADSSGNNNTGTLNNFDLTGGSTSNWTAPGAVISGVSCGFIIGNVAVNPSTLLPGVTTTLTASGASSYTWNTGATTPSIAVTSTNNVSYTVTGSDGTCNVTDTGTVALQGSALNFDGSSYVAVNEIGNGLDNLGLGNFTMEAWINMANLNGGNNDGINSIFRKAGDYNFYVNNGVLAAEIWPGGIGNSTWIQINATTTLPTNSWQHVAFTWNNASQTGTFYINGVVDNSTANAPGNIGSSEPLWVGMSQNYQQGFIGSIDEAKIYNYGLSACQINAGMNCELAQSKAGLMLYYKFNEGGAGANNQAVGIAADSSGSGNNGSLSNFALNGPTSNWVTPGGVTSGVSCGFIISQVSIANTATTAICAGATTTLTASGATTYTWSTNATTASISSSPTVTTTYTVTGSDGTCTVSDTLSVMVNTLPIVTVNSATICAGNTATLTTNSGTAITYTWSTGDNTTSITTSPTATINYTVTGTDANNCISIPVMDTVTVNNLPVVNINGVPTFTAAICSGTTGTLTASGATSYTWMPINSNMATISGPVTSSINFTLTGTDANGCANTALAMITENPLPTLTITATSNTICVGSTSTLTASGATSYTWANTGATGGSFSDSPIATTQYTVTGTDGNGCMNSDTLTVMVNNCTTGINKLENSSQVAVYPNPNNGTFVITTTENTKTILVTDMLGNELLSVTPNGTTTNVNLGAQPSGMYFVKVITDNWQTIKRITISN